MSRKSSPVLGMQPEDCDRIAQGICREILESEREKEPLRDRWVRLRAIHDCEENTSQVQLIEGMKPYMAPLSRAKSDRIVGAVVNGITGLNPYVELVDPGNTNVDLDAVCADLMVLAADAGDDAALRQGTEDAFLTNTGVWRIRVLVDESPYDSPAMNDSDTKVTRFDWEAIDPVDVCCYPPYYGTFAAAKTVGHRFSEMVFRVKAAMAAGKYAESDIHGGDDPMRSHRTIDDQTSDYTAATPSDDFVELWEVITQLPLDEKGKPTDGVYNRFLCVVALTDEKLLSIQPYPYSKPWYVEVRTDYQRKRIFPNSSIAQRLQGLQIAYSDIFTLILQAGIASIGPITILTGGGLMSKVTQAKPFMVLEAPADVKVQTLAANPQVGALPAMLEKIEQLADALTGIGRSGEGQAIPNSTATQIDALQQAANEAKDQYTQVIAGAVEMVFQLMMEFYRVHGSELKAAYGDRLSADPEVVAALKPTVKVNGRNGSTSSVMVIQKLQLLMSLLSALGPNSPYDMEKIVDQIAQSLDLPFSLDRIKKDPNPLDALLRMPEIQHLLMQGETLPALLEEIKARGNGQQPGAQAQVPIQQPGAQGLPPGEPDMALGQGGIGSPTGGATPPMFNPGGGPPLAQGPGPMSGI